MKSPRRVIDLRECINLEVGLEYKNLSHIMSLGTFKRTFFMAAPATHSCCSGGTCWNRLRVLEMVRVGGSDGRECEGVRGGECV